LSPRVGHPLGDGLSGEADATCAGGCPGGGQADGGLCKGRRFSGGVGDSDQVSFGR